MTSFSRETSACFHKQCDLCSIPREKNRKNAIAAWVVDIAIDRVTSLDNITTAVDVAGTVRELSADYQMSNLQGHIAGAVVLGLAGDCPSKQFELNELHQGEQ